jgi:hypothetical protein
MASDAQHRSRVHVFVSLVVISALALGIMAGTGRLQHAAATSQDCAQINDTYYGPAQDVGFDLYLDPGGVFSVTASAASGTPTEVTLFVQYAPLGLLIRMGL